MEYIAYLTVIGIFENGKWNVSKKKSQKYIAGNIGKIKVIAYGKTAIIIHNNLGQMLIASGKYLPDREGSSLFVSSVETIKDKITNFKQKSKIEPAKEKKYRDLREEIHQKERNKAAHHTPGRAINTLTGKPFGHYNIL